MPLRPGTHKPFKPATPRLETPTRWGQGRGGRQWRNTRERVFRRDKFLCQIHLRRGELRPVSLHGKDHGVCDHIVPLSQGGDDSEHNLQTICQACDKAKTGRESRGGW